MCFAPEVLGPGCKTLLASRIKTANPILSTIDFSGLNRHMARAPWFNAMQLVQVQLGFSLLAIGTLKALGVIELSLAMSAGGAREVRPSAMHDPVSLSAPLSAGVPGTYLQRACALVLSLSLSLSLSRARARFVSFSACVRAPSALLTPGYVDTTPSIEPKACMVKQRHCGS